MNNKTLRETISHLWSEYMISAESGDLRTCDAISETIKHLEARELRSIVSTF